MSVPFSQLVQPQSDYIHMGIAVTVDELTMLEWVLSEFRANCQTLHPGINRQKCSDTLDSLAKTFRLYDGDSYQKALEDTDVDGRMWALNQMPPENYILVGSPCSVMDNTKVS